MNRQDVSWDDYRTVLAIAGHRSLAGAAAALTVNQSTIFRRLGALEERLGVRLFDRQRTGYLLTSAGEDMVELARRMSEEITVFERRLSGLDKRPEGELRITTNDTILVHFLTPILARFCAAYPLITLDIILGNQQLNLSRRDADIAIRATGDPGETLVGRRLSAIDWGVFGKAGSRHLLPDDYANHRWIGFSDIDGPQSPARWLNENVGRQNVIWRVNSVLGVGEAIAAGAGLGILPIFLARSIPGIERVSEQTINFNHFMWMLAHPDLKNTARVRAFMDFAAGEITRSLKALS